MHCKPVAIRGQEGFNQVSGNPKRKPHAVCEEAEAWTSFDLPTGQWSEDTSRSTSLSEKVWQDSKVVITDLNPTENLW